MSQVVHNHYYGTQEDALDVEIEESSNISRYMLAGLLLVLVACGIYFYSFSRKNDIFPRQRTSNISATNNLADDYQRRRQARVERMRKQLEAEEAALKGQE